MMKFLFIKMRELLTLNEDDVNLSIIYIETRKSVFF